MRALIPKHTMRLIDSVLGPFGILLFIGSQVVRWKDSSSDRVDEQVDDTKG